MEPLIKIDLNQVLSGDEPVVLELGCGRNKRPGAIGIDKIDVISDTEYRIDKSLSNEVRDKTAELCRRFPLR